MHEIERPKGPDVPSVVKENGYELHNIDSKYINFQTTGHAYIITEAPNLPKEYIQETLQHYGVRSSFIFCDHDIHLPYPGVQYGWDTYRRSRAFIIPHIINLIPKISWIVDPFAGYGYIGEVAMGMGCPFIGAEIKTDIFERLVENLKRCHTT